eukprot:CAMPEP_0205946148 /NCGR_PEP_ID=MMETSP1325-20131115/68342_1 /ASSEMBLY_ACC=CAM_ASM_000708 /TAXON_ID=236786 /ORGANISM="Florenciella sp., Strain RCC1007" /LENGTH=73 /DNA_ID=CAMNT_0053317189 /DNA_START=54 /DNA_END=272 /DNA_ORIENTATION=-
MNGTKNKTKHRPSQAKRAYSSLMRHNNYECSDDESVGSVGTYETGVHGDFMEEQRRLKKLRELNDRFQFLREN